METDELDAKLYENYRKAGEETGYWGAYFLRELRKKGGLATLKRMLIPSKSDSVAKGFQALIDAGRTDLSVEAVALDEQFRHRFTPDELAEAERRLSSVPEYKRTIRIKNEDLHPSEIPDAVEFTEGAVRRVVVNAYERDRDARAACIKAHGTRCAVCDMSFAERYGELGRGFIHVHHKKPLALRRAEYKLRPSIDLVPVCPNCHAMLHTFTPPIAVQELKAIYERHVKASQSGSTCR
jgi:5-methylcytosine-specific restriction protein A